jgi:hypothetical protein
MYKSLLRAVQVNPDDKNIKLLEPKKDKEVGNFSALTENAVAQADLTYWPTAPGNLRYVLTIVDIVSRAIDAQAIRNKDQTSVKNAFTKIFSRNRVKPNFKILQVDPGAEFLNEEIKSYFHEKNISIRYGRTGRHNQQAIVEYYQGVVGKVLNTKMSLKELETNKRNISWVKELEQVIAELNKKYKREPKPLSHHLQGPKISRHKTMLRIGQDVHYKLEEPRNIVTNEKFHGRFRHGELRFSKNPAKIVNILHTANSYPRYVIAGFPKMSFSRDELKI